MDVSIYSLTDPRNGEIRYVGKTQQRPIDRLYRHIARARSGSRSNVSFWIRSLLEDGLKPVVDILEVVDFSLGSEKEKFWIARMENAGVRLTNMTKGGYGSIGYKHTEASKKKIREARANQVIVISEDHKVAIREAMKAIGHRPPITGKGEKRGPLPEETRAKISTALKGKFRPEEVRRKISESRTGKKYPRKVRTSI